MGQLQAELARRVERLRHLRQKGEPRHRVREARDGAHEVAERLSEIRRKRQRLSKPWHEYSDYHRAVTAGERGADPELAAELLAAMNAIAPTDTQDPRLAGWYHTVELGN